LRHNHGRRAGKHRFAAAFSLPLACILLVAPAARSQVAPNEQWKTIETRHFRIHFTPALEEMARRAAPNAERAFELLSRELVAPHGKVDLVIADNVDYTNGYATPFPSNRIVIFAHPPVDETALRNYADWSQLVITHELTHIFHLDRAAGIWKAGRYLLGRHPALFPNVYLPAWITEGLAVYYESRLTGTGRLEGSEHYMIARAAAEAGSFPRLGEISLSTSRFPGGETVYAYGGFIFDYLSRTRGSRSIRDFVELNSRVIFPLTLNGKSKRVFGITFADAWKQWTDSLLRVTQRTAGPIEGWRDLTHEGWIVSPPRWLDSSTILYGASTARDVPRAYTMSIAGKEKPLGRRNAASANLRLRNGDLLFSQPDFVDPYRFRNDLYIEHDGRQSQLTHGARLSSPDVRSDGVIVAVQDVPGSTRLVRVSPDGKSILPITRGALDEQWLDPRWSPDGSRIAAIRLPRGNHAEVVVIDTAGAATFSYQFTSAMPIAPSWSRDGTKLYLSSDNSGTMQIYSVVLPPLGTGSVTRLSNAVTGMFDPEQSPDSSWLAALLYRTDGYHLGIAPLPRAATVRDTTILGERSSCSDCRISDTGIPAVAPRFDGAARTYSPWRSLLPTYWEPVVESSTGNGTKIGGTTSGYDVIGRHSYFAQGTYDTKHREGEGFGAYRYSGLGQPYLDFSAEQSYDHFVIVNQADKVVGDFSQRSRIYSASAAITRPRVRTFASLSLGAELENRNYLTDPDTLLAHLSPVFRQPADYPSLFATLGWSNTRRAPLSISSEDGVSLSVTGRERWRHGGGDVSSAPSHEIVGTTSAYKSLDLPGFAHHVIAVRGAAGYTDGRTISTFSAGGLSGTSLAVLAGFSVGAERRTFGVRGFPPSAERGIRAFAGSVEYRAPIAAPSRHIPFIPLLFDRISATAFADAGRAYCPASSASAAVCSMTDSQNPWLASVGGELNLDAALYYDVPARVRLGSAVPIANREQGRAKTVSFYLAFGASF
jgi:WD40-like Beta Propeller Repeat